PINGSSRISKPIWKNRTDRSGIADRSVGMCVPWSRSLVLRRSAASCMFDLTKNMRTVETTETQRHRARVNARFRRALCLCVFVVSAILTASLSVAQNATIRVNTQLVQVSVVVRDKNGPVAGLPKEDFSITDNGKAQRIDVFSASDIRNLKQSS